MKGLKIVNIILFSIICALELAIVFIFVNSLIALLSGNLSGLIFTIIFYLPYFLLGSAILFVFAVIITITTKVKINRGYALNIQKTKFDKLCIFLPWFFLFFNVVLYIVFYVTATVLANNH